MQEMTSGFSLFAETLLVFKAQDPNVEWCTKVAAAIQNAIQCCCVISDGRKSYTKTSADCFFKCSVAQPCPALCNPKGYSHQAPLSMEFSKQEHWSGLPCPSPEALPKPGIKPRFPALQVDFLPSEPPEKAENTGVGNLSLLLGNFPTQELNQGLLHCRRILYLTELQNSLGTTREVFSSGYIK